jgi:prefoldin subunit 5
MCCLQIILSQEKNIQQLNQLIESLQRQLLHCRGSNNTVHTTTITATEVSEVEGHEIIDDDNL